MRARLDILRRPGRLGPYVDLFCAVSHGSEVFPGTGRFLLRGAAWMLALDARRVAGLVSDFPILRGRLAADMAVHMEPLIDAVASRQLDNGDPVFETPLDFLERRDEPCRALAVTKAHLRRMRRLARGRTGTLGAPARWTWTPARRLRIGYVCGDLAMHPVGFSVRGLLLGHDKARVETVVYDRTPNPNSAIAGPVSAGADLFRNCRDCSVGEIGRLIRGDEIDILVDLSGAANEAGPTVFAGRPAPVKVAMIGFPGAMGRETVDYTVADAITVPESGRAGFDEKLILMPGSFLPLDDTFASATPGVERREVGLPDQAFLMAGFNRSSKITGETIRVWLACLKRIPRGLLWLAVDDDQTGDNLRALMARADLSPERLIISPRAYILEHIRRHGLADVTLDPLGFNGGHSTVLSLLCGVPVVTRPGQSFAWRMSAALLSRAGLDECVVASPRDYIDQVARLAEDRELVARYRRLLAPSRLARVFETGRYTANLEAAFLEIARRRFRGEPDRDLDVAGLTACAKLR